MEINLSWFSVDTFAISNQYQTIGEFISELVIFNELKHDIDYTIHSNENISISYNSQISAFLNNLQNSQISLSISPSPSHIEKIKSLLGQGEVKEKKYSEMLKILENLKKNTNFEKNQLDLIFLCQVKEKDKFYNVLLDKIIESVLKPISFFKEIKDIQNNIMKMKTDKIVTLYYKIFLTRGDKCITHMYKYCNLYIANSKTIFFFVNAFIRLVTTIIHSLNEEIIAKIKHNEIFLKNQKEYLSSFAFIENNISIFPVIKYMNNASHSVVFSGIEKPITLTLSESTFIIIREIINQFPNYEKLKDSIKDDKLVYESLAMSFIRDFELYRKFHIQSRNFLYDYLLYEN